MHLLLHHARAMRDHRFTRAHASEYVDGELSESGRRRVERHAETCPQCRRLIETLRRTVTGMRALRGTSPQGLRERVVAHLRDHEARGAP